MIRHFFNIRGVICVCNLSPVYLSLGSRFEFLRLHNFFQDKISFNCYLKLSVAYFEKDCPLKRSVIALKNGKLIRRCPNDSMVMNTLKSHDSTAEKCFLDFFLHDSPTMSTLGT
jgi:hypothetical protein